VAQTLEVLACGQWKKGAWVQVEMAVKQPVAVACSSRTVLLINAAWLLPPPSLFIIY